MPIAAGRTLGYGKVELPGGSPCVIFVSATRPASDSDWGEYVAWFRKNAKLGDKVRTLVMDRAGGPNAAQRKQLNDVTAPFAMHVSVLSPSAVGRSIVTAMNWFKKDSYKAFMPDQLDSAIAHLEVTGQLAVEVRQIVTDLMRDLDK